MKVLISSLDTGPSDCWVFEAEVEEITPSNIVKVYEQTLILEGVELVPGFQNHTMLHWQPASGGAAATFIMSAFDSYFGVVRVIGFVEEAEPRILS